MKVIRSLLEQLSIDKSDSISLIWERLVLANIISFSGTTITFGIEVPFIDDETIERIEFPSVYSKDSIMKLPIVNHKSITENTMIVAPNGQAGFEAKIIFPSSESVAYIQVKISQSQNPLSNIIDKTVIYSLIDAFSCNQSIADVHIYVYNFGDIKEPNEIKNKLESIYKNMIENLEQNTYNDKLTSCGRISNDEIPIFQSYVRSFLHQADSHVHYLNREDIMEWMIPSLLPFAVICNKVEEDTHKSQMKQVDSNVDE
jgi:hypothetical protein